ncbi:MAG TPA: glycosyltransferase family 2 protein [Terriglobales bacterium]|jgi:glycosyltransferase involved in cell wall biosynthesis
MDITVIISTYNRSRDLAKALENVAASRLPESTTWEVLVADNNSNDDTCEVVKSFSERYPRRFRYIFEPRPGKSYALNTAIRESRGEILAFLDDDVTVEPAWLYNLTSTLHDNQWAGTGGRTLPAHEFSLPPWLALDGPCALGGIFCAHFDLGDKPTELDRPPYGANMAYRKAMFEKYGEFRTDLGPSPDKDIPRPNEDTEFGRRVIASGERLRYEPGAIAYHPVPTERLNQEYFLSWWFDYGRALIREVGERPTVYGIPRHFFSVPRLIFTILPRRALRWLFTTDTQQRFFKKCWVWLTVGQIVEIPRVAREIRKNKAKLRLKLSRDGENAVLGGYNRE